MTYYGIYRITNLTNGKMYIGQHVTSNIDDGYMGSGKIIKSAIKKYGKENFRKEWLMFCEDADELDYMERVYVDQTWVDRSDTYNIALGGDSQVGKNNRFFGKHHSLETLKKMSESHKGQNSWWYGRHGKDNPNFGKPAWNRGKHPTEETRKKMSKAHTGVKMSTEASMKRSKNNTGRHWYTNGQINVFMYECPDGFYSGMIHFNKKEGSK